MSKYYYDYKDLDRHNQQKITQGSVIPRPIAWITSKNEDGSINLAPFSYFAELSPSLLAVSFTKMPENFKDTYRNIMRTKEAVINIASIDLLEELDQSSRPLKYGESELSDSNLSISDDSTLVDVPYINEALINFEVKIIKELEFNDFTDSYIDNNVVFMRIVAVHLSKEVYDRDKGYVLSEVLKPVARLGGPNYATIKPIDFSREH